MMFTKSVLVAAVLTACSFSNSALAEPIGLVGMFYAEKTSTQQAAMISLEQGLKSQGCLLRREGRIFGANGGYKIAAVNRFFYLECENSLLSQLPSNNWIDKMNQRVENLAIFEGVVRFSGSASASLPGNRRSYILKLSDYNNINPQKRNADLARLDQMVQVRKNKYTLEAQLDISAAYGMRRPDEVVLIHYPSEEAGAKFRNNDSNADIMAGIGNFNRDHLIQFIYFSAASNR